MADTAIGNAIAAERYWTDPTPSITTTYWNRKGLSRRGFLATSL